MNTEIEEKKKSGGKIFLVAIIFLLIGLVGGYYISNNLINNKNNLKEDQNDKKQETSKDSANIEEAKKLVYKYYKNGLINTISLDDGNWNQTYNMDEEILSVLILNLSESDWKEIACEKVAEKGKGDFKGYYVYMYDGVGYQCSGKSISYDVMNKLYKELYGSSKELPKKSGAIDFLDDESIGSVSAYLAYNEQNNIFVLGNFMGDANGPYANHYYSAIKSAEKKDDKFVVSLAYTVLLDYDFGEEGAAVYQVGKDKIKPDDERIKGLNPEQIMNKYINQLDTFEFTFVKDGDHYILECAK